MKKNNWDDNEFRNDFHSLNRVPAAGTECDFNLTFVADAGLSTRLASEVQFFLRELQYAWPAFRRDPAGFVGCLLRQLRISVAKTIRRPHVVSGVATALLLVMTTILAVLVLEKHTQKASAAVGSDEDLSLVEILDFQNDETPRTDRGIGANGEGRVGFAEGRGEGSRPEPAKARGGGGGGSGNPLPPSQGRPPQPSEIPAPIPTTLVRLPQALPEAGIDIDPALWSKLSFASYGDPRSKSTVPSNGPGYGGGVGTNNGSGIGEGDGPGFGPGRNGNIGGDDKGLGGRGRGGAPGGDNPGPDDPNRVWTVSQVTTRARVLFKPEPQYTEEARRNQITGTVILRVVFSRSGEVTNIRALQSLPGGLTERAINAARLIRFVPATRSGQPVATYMQLEYNFNLY